MMKAGGASYEVIGQDGITGDEEDTLASAEPMIQVKAPATLPEGYKLDVQVGQKTFTVTIPPGGVQEGQTFQVPLPGGTNVDITEVAIARVSVPTGNWRDGLCDCFNQGICHPLLWNSLFCHTIAIAQVMTRMKLDLWAKPIEVRHGAREIAKKTFYVILIWTITTLVYSNLVLPFMIYPMLTHVEMVSVYSDFLNEEVMVEEQVVNPGCEGLLSVFNGISQLLAWSLYLSFIYWMTCTRAYIRSKYGIPARYLCGRSSGDLAGQESHIKCHPEDCILSTFCACCTVSQMARHTMDYDTYPGTCCTATGVRDSVPDVL